MEKINQKKKTVSLVLGSGGARGVAHIGVIRWLEENDYEIKSISGCSIGSFIGGAYAAGKLDAVEKILRTVEKTDIVKMLDFSWGDGGLFKGEKLIKEMVKVFGKTDIEDLPIPYTAVATDIELEKEVWMNSGSLFDAIRASISLPLFFTPFNYKGTKLIDGGVLNPVPIAPTFNDDTDITIAVNLGGPKEIIKASATLKKESTTLSFADSFNDIVHNFQKGATESLGMYDVADKAFDTMQGAIARQKIAAYPPDVLIEIARNACGTLDFDKSAEMIDLGYKKTKEVFKNN